jgi:O-antigen biosynthesis protein
MSLASFLRRLRPILFPKNSWQEHWMRYGLVCYSRWLGWHRRYARWQKDNERQPSTQNDNREVCFFPWQPGQPLEAFQQKLSDCQTGWLLIASSPLQVAPCALQEIESAVVAYPGADLIYSDGDWLDHRGQRIRPWMKPAFGIDSLRSQNYIVPFFAVRKSLGDSLGWLNLQAGSAWAEDLVWRVVEQAREVVHIPRVLYHQQGERAVSPADEWHAIEAHLQRTGLEALVESGPAPSTFHLRYALKAQPLISIIIPSHELAGELRRCVSSILAKSTYQNFEVLIAENNSSGVEIFQAYRDLQAQDARIRMVEYHHAPFNYAEINNYAVSKARGEILLFLNNDTEVINPDWLERMLEYVQRPDVGAVGAKLYYPQKLLQHVGVIIGMHGTAGHQFSNFPREFSGYFCNTRLAQNFSAVTAACLMMRREVFEQAGGFATAYRLAYNDVDLCLKICQANHVIVWTPCAELYHYESLTRGYDSNTDMLTRLQQEADLFRSRWKSFLETGDPYYSPNLALDRGYFSLRPGVCDHTPRSVRGLSANDE